jgi:predicted adenylyl cyclase CyaB
MTIVSRKARLNTTDETNLIKALQDVGLEFSEAYFQHDRIFLPRGYRSGSRLPRMVLRTKVPVGKSVSYRLILKRETEQRGAAAVYATHITNYAETVHMLQQLGFGHKADIELGRQEINMGQGVMLYLDEVKGLGKYLKVEVAKADDVEATAETTDELLEIMKLLGIREKTITADSYRSLLRG